MVTAPPRHRRKTRVIVPGASCSWTRSCKWAQVPTVHSLGLGLVLPLTHITPSHALQGGACAHPFNTVPLLSDHWPLLSQPWPQPTPQQPSSFTSFESDPRSWWLLPLRPIPVPVHCSNSDYSHAFFIDRVVLHHSWIIPDKLLYLFCLQEGGHVTCLSELSSACNRG